MDDGQAGDDREVGPRPGAKRGSCRWSQDRRSWQSPPSSRAIERLAPAGGARIPAHDNPDSHTSSAGPARHAEVARIQEPDPAADTGLVKSGDSDQSAESPAGPPQSDPQPCRCDLILSPLPRDLILSPCPRPPAAGHRPPAKPGGMARTQNPEPAGLRVQGHSIHCDIKLWGRWESNPHCQAPKACASWPIGLRPLLVGKSTGECRSLRVTVRAKKAQVLLPVVQPVAVDVIHVQYYRLAVPLGRDATRPRKCTARRSRAVPAQDARLRP